MALDEPSKSSVRNRRWFVAAILALSAMVTVNVSAYFPDIVRIIYPLFFVMPPIAFLVFGRAVIMGQRIAKAAGINDAWLIVEKVVPGWLFAVFSTAGIYAIAMFFLSSFGEGMPTVIAGKTVLSDHGRIVREITETEYWAGQARFVRGFSGMLMLSLVFASMTLYVVWRIDEKGLAEVLGHKAGMDV
ncbi:MAG: hypothetical protein K1X53_06590 [Candidatus Sumerlaeaceae bacterium]|nr:hypothetical protein [Candidatus Sumerlaeaceae bacterium]